MSAVLAYPVRVTASAFVRGLPSHSERLIKASFGCSALRATDAKRRESDAASKTRSLRRNCPSAAEIAGNPPAVGSATPGVLRKNVSVIT